MTPRSSFQERQVSCAMADGDATAIKPRATASVAAELMKVRHIICSSRYISHEFRYIGSIYKIADMGIMGSH